jgi:hypothetical protein
VGVKTIDIDRLCLKFDSAGTNWRAPMGAANSQQRIVNGTAWNEFGDTLARGVLRFERQRTCRR